MKAVGALIVIIGGLIGGFLFYQRQTTTTNVKEMLKNHYGYTDFGYKFKLKSDSKEGGAAVAVMTVTYLPEGTSWDIVCWNAFGSWDRSPEQMKKDMADMDEIDRCLKGLANGIRIGSSVYNSSSEVNSCRDAMKLYTVKHPSSNIKPI